MKKIIYNLLVVVVLLMSTFNVKGQVQIQASGLNILNITEIADSYYSENPPSDVLDIGNFTGIDFPEQSLTDLLAVAQIVKDTLEYDVYSVEFPFISTNANGGLEGNYNLATDQITSEKYILFCYVLTGNTEGELAKFYTAIVDNTDAESDEDNEEITAYLSSVAQEDFNEAGLLNRAFDSEKEALESFLIYNSSTQYKISLNNKPTPFFDLKESTTFLTPAGTLIPIPKDYSVAFYKNDNEWAGFVKRIRSIAPDNTVKEYQAFYYNTGPKEGQFAGYAYREGTIIALGGSGISTIFYSYLPFTNIENGNPPTPLYNVDEKVLCWVGIEYPAPTECPGIYSSGQVNWTKVIYKVPWIDQSYNNVEGRNYTGEGNFTNLTDISQYCEFPYQPDAIGIVEHDIDGILAYYDNGIEGPLITYPSFDVTILGVSSWPCPLTNVAFDVGSFLLNIESEKNNEIWKMGVVYDNNKEFSHIVWNENGRRWAAYLNDETNTWDVLLYDVNYKWLRTSYSLTGYTDFFENMAEGALIATAVVGGIYVAVGTIVGLGVLEVFVFEASSAAYATHFGVASTSNGAIATGAAALFALNAPVEAGIAYMVFVYDGDASKALKDFKVGLATGVIAGNAGRIWKFCKWLRQSTKFVSLYGSQLDDAAKFIVKLKLSDGTDFVFDSSKYFSEIRNGLEQMSPVNAKALINRFQGEINSSGSIDLIEWMIKDSKRFKAWKLLDDAGDALAPLKTNLEFLKRLDANPKLINYLDNVPEVHRVNLVANITEWAKHYDARILLKNGDIDGALVKLDGTLGSAIPGPNGVNYVDDVLTFDAPAATVCARYDGIVVDNTDISLIAQKLHLQFPNSSLNKWEEIVGTAKQHLFVNEHLVPISTSTGVIWRKGRFAPQEFLADNWLKVKNGTNDLDDLEYIRKLVGHEYSEAKLMLDGIPFRGKNVEPSVFAHGAHDLSMNEGPLGAFSHYSTQVGLVQPTVINDNFSNIDEVISQIKFMIGL